MAESFVEKRKRELREKNGGGTISASSFVERRRKQLRGEVETQESQIPKLALKEKSLEPIISEKAPYAVDFKAEQAKPQQQSVFQDKVPAANLIQTGQGIQSTLQNKVPAANLVQQTGRGPANASQIPGISEYGIRKKAIDETNIPEIAKLPSRAINYAAYGNPLGIAASRSFAGNSGASRRDSTDFPLLDKATDAINNLVTPFLTPTGQASGQGIIGSTYDAAGKLQYLKPVMKYADYLGDSLIKSGLIPKASKATADRVAKTIITETVAGAPQGAAFGVMQGQDSAEEIINNAKLGAAGGGLLAGGGSILSEAGSNLFKRLFGSAATVAEEATPNAPMLALPEGRGTVRQSQAAGRSNLSSNTDPIINDTGWTPEPLGLPEANIGAPTTARRTTKPGLNSVLEQMKPIVDERTIPPMDHMNDLAKWIHTRIKDNFGQDISLNEIRVLPYDDMKTVANEIRSRISVEDTARQVARELGYDYDKLLSTRSVDKSLVSKAKQTQNMRAAAGVDNLVKSSSDRYQTIIGRASDPETVIAKPGISDIRASQRNNKIPTLTREPLNAENVKRPLAEGKVGGSLAPMKNLSSEVKKQSNLSTTVKKKSTPGERGFAQTLKQSEKTPEGFTSKLDTKYEQTTNRGDLDKAEERIKDRAGATRFILEESKGGMTSEQSITAQRLIDTHLKEGNTKAAEEVADAILRESTRSAQFLQSLSTYNKLSPEGVYMVAKRMANKVNQTSSKLVRKAEVTPQMADDIVNLATVNQKMTGVQDLSNDAVDILKRAKAGEKLTDAETSVIQKFVDESQQFIKETSKKPVVKEPKLPKDKRVRDNVSSFLDAQEAAAKARLRAKGHRISSTPLDIWADYAVIGAAKMGRNIIKFSEWSEQMIKDIGENIRPHLESLYERSREVFDLSSKKVTSKTVSAAERLTQKVIKTKELSPEEADSLLQLVSQVDNLSGEAKRTASQDLQVILQSLDKPSIGRKISSLQTQAQLLNPKTIVRNVVGNELFYRLERINKYVSTPIDIARSKLTGTDRTVTFRTHNQGKYWENFINGGRAGWKGVNINGIETQYDLASPAFTGKYNPLKYTEKALGAALRSFDNAAYSRAMNKSLGELGTLDAINSGVKPTKEYVQEFIRNADENVNKISQNYGKYVTFQDNNLISQGFTKFKRGLNLGKDFGAGDLVIKYPKTPGALLMRAIEYSPAGFLRSAKIAAGPLLRNGVEKNTAETVQALSRAIIGTGGLSMFGYYLMDKDILTGAASTDRDIRSLQTKIGQGAYQVNLSALYRFVKSGFDDDEATIKEGDQLYNYDWLQPVSVAISLGANVRKNQGADSSKIASGIAGTAYNSVSGALNTLTEQSLLKGVEQALSGYTGETSTDKVVSIIADMPASFVATFSNQIKQTGDNTKRETYAPNVIDQSINKVKAKIPRLAETLPKKYDTLGGEQTHYQDGNAFNIFANPGFPSKYKLSPEAKTIVDLIKATGDESLAPRVPDKKLDGIKLTGEEYSRLSQLQGEETKKLISELDTTMSVEDQAKEVTKILTEAGKTAKERLREEFPRLVKEDD
jgi:hypothetical protein